MADFSKRLNNAIPGGAHTYSRGDDQFPLNAPSLLISGKGAYVFDANDKEYLDYGMALRAVTIGYADEEINAAAIEAINKGNNLTRASMIELEAAELLIDQIPSAEMVKFAKNGSNVTTAAVKLARAFTGKRYVCIPKQHPFFSFDDWFIGVTEIPKGIPDSHSANTLFFDYGDIESLKQLFTIYDGLIAAVMLEPATIETPCPKQCDKRSAPSCADCSFKTRNFLKEVEVLCREEDALFILDEMITGFRWDLKGAQHLYDVNPDLSTFGKGMANGFSVAALVGRSDVMNQAAINIKGHERTFLLSSTHGAEMSSLAAFIATVKVYKERNVCNKLWKYGESLCTQFNSLARCNGISEYLKIVGPFVSPNYQTLDSSANTSLEMRTLFSQEMIRSGVLMPWIALSFSHGDEELDKTLSAAESAMKIYSMALEDGVEKYLDGPAIKPVFRRFN